MKNNIRKNALWNTIGISLNSFNSLFFLIIVNRVNGVNDAGLFSFSFSLACLFFVIGIYSGRTYQVSDVKEDLKDLEYLIHKIMTSTLMMVVTLIFIAFKNYDLEKNIMILAITFYKALEAFSDTSYGYLQKNNRLYLAGISLALKSLLAIVLFLIIDLLTKSLILASLAIVFVNILIILVFDFPRVKEVIKIEPVKMTRVLSLFQKGFAVFIFSFLAIYIVNVSKYVIDERLTNYYQTVFNIIIMPATIISLCGQYILQPLLNKIIEDYSQKKYDSFKRTIQRIILYLIGFDLVVEIGAFVIGIPVLNIVYGINLAGYKGDLLIIILGALFYAIATVYSTVLITMRKNRVQIGIFGISALVGFGLANLLIMGFKIHGAVYAYFGTMLVHLILLYLYFNYEFNKLRRE